MIAESIVNFWKSANLNPDMDGGINVHPKDEEVIRRRNMFHDRIYGPSEYEHALREGQLSDKKFHLNLIPQPYLGNLERATIIILLANPGLSAQDYYFEITDPKFRTDLVRNINQEISSHIFLNTRWSWTSGFAWWEKKIRGVASIISERRNWTYGETLDQLSQEIASIELVPYHSRYFGLKERLPSSEFAISLAQELSRDPSKTIIATRKVSDWALGDYDNVVKYNGGEARAASLGPKSRGGKRILDVFGVS